MPTAKPVFQGYFGMILLKFEMNELIKFERRPFVCWMSRQHDPAYLVFPQVLSQWMCRHLIIKIVEGLKLLNRLKDSNICIEEFGFSLCLGYWLCHCAFMQSCKKQQPMSIRKHFSLILCQSRKLWLESKERISHSFYP